MAKYYQVATMADIKAALIDYYGAGVTIHTDSSSLLIFSCAAVSDKVIKITGYADLIAYYGDTYDVGTGDITNSVVFGGTTTTGTTSSAEMVCGDTFILMSIMTSLINCKFWIIGQLTDGQFAVIGYIGSASHTDGAMGYLTATQTVFRLSGLEGEYQAGSKRVLLSPVLITESGAVYSGSSIVTFIDIYSVSRQMGNAASAKGTGYFLTPSGGYTNVTYGLTNSLMVEVTN